MPSLPRCCSRSVLLPPYLLPHAIIRSFVVCVCVCVSFTTAKPTRPTPTQNTRQTYHPSSQTILFALLCLACPSFLPVLPFTKLHHRRVLDYLTLSSPLLPFTKHPPSDVWVARTASFSFCVCVWGGDCGVCVFVFVCGVTRTKRHHANDVMELDCGDVVQSQRPRQTQTEFEMAFCEVV